ncbi:MAG: hypothetical protein ACHP8A_00570 [Terriglobales bacterium]|nr:hypothetical protein [Terriglobales bacterium]
MNNFFAILIVGMTSVGVVGLGIASAYWAVIGILKALSYHSSPSSVGSLTLITRTLVASESQASGD